MQAAAVCGHGLHLVLQFVTSEGGDHIDAALPVGAPARSEAANYEPIRGSSPKPNEWSVLHETLVALLREASRSWARWRVRSAHPSHDGSHCLPNLSPARTPRNNPPDVSRPIFVRRLLEETIKQYQRDSSLQNIIMTNAENRDRIFNHLFSRALREVREDKSV
jgi:hypothetical protein